MEIIASNKIAIKVKCPAEMPEHLNCFFNNGSGNCETCTYPMFREKILQDERDRLDLRTNLVESLRRMGGLL
jgi:hypothetical protein